MQLTDKEVDVAAAKMAKAAMNYDWDKMEAADQESYRKAVRGMAAIFDYPRNKDSWTIFLNWVGHAPQNYPQRKKAAG